MILSIQLYGIHPTEIGTSKEEIDNQIKIIEKLAKEDKVVAIGEIRT